MCLCSIPSRGGLAAQGERLRLQKRLQGKSSAHEEGEDRNSAPPTKQDERPCGKYDWNTTPPIEQASEASTGCDQKLDCTTVADEPSTVKSHIEPRA